MAGRAGALAALYPVQHRWGSLTGGRLRSGGLSYQLIVLAPGTDDRGRVRVRAWLVWPFVGTTVVGLLALVLAHVVPPWVAITTAASVLMGGYALLRHGCRRERRGLHLVHAEYDARGGSHADLHRCRRLEAISTGLSAAEEGLRRGDLTPVQFELVWGAMHAAAGVLADPDAPARA